MNFSLSQAYSWVPKGSAIHDILNLDRRLSISSFATEWEIDICLKRPKQFDAEKLPTDKSLYVVKFKDSNHTCIVMSEDLFPESIVIGSTEIDEVISTTGDLIMKSQWKCSGKRFLINDNIVVSTGLIVKGMTAPKPVIELLFSPEHDIEDVSLEHINAQLKELAVQLIPGECQETMRGLSLSDPDFANKGIQFIPL